MKNRIEVYVYMYIAQIPEAVEREHTEKAGVGRLKKKIVVCCGLLAVSLSIWSCGNSADEEAADISGNDVRKEDMAQDQTDVSENGIADAGMDVSGNGGADAGTDASANGNTNVGNGISGNDVLETAVETLQDMLSEEGVLYVLQTSEGSNVGMVPIVAGNAVVLLDEGQTEIHEGDYVPEETVALQEKLQEMAVQAAAEGKIPDWAFYREALLRRYDWPEGVTSIGRFAFARSSLESVAIPEGVTTISSGAFYHCDSLTEVTIPKSVTTIEENAFAHTPWLENWLAGSDADAVAGNGGDAEAVDRNSGGADEAGMSEATRTAETVGTAEAADAADGSGDFLIVGDGILLAYRGQEKNPQLPAEVKSIAAGAAGISQ